MKTRKIILFFSVVFFIIILLTGCEPSLSIREEARVATVPVPEVVNFTEAKNIEKRLKLMDDPNTIMWIYCIGETGAVIYYGPVVGKVTSSGKRLEQFNIAEMHYGDTVVLEKMQADGTYGSSDPYVFWFDPNGIYHQWSGLYFLTSVSIKIQTPVLNFRDVDEEMMAKQQKAIEILKKGGHVNENLDEVDENGNLINE